MGRLEIPGFFAGRNEATPSELAIAQDTERQRDPGQGTIGQEVPRPD